MPPTLHILVSQLCEYDSVFQDLWGRWLLLSMQVCIHYSDKLPFNTKHSDFCLMYATTSANIHRNYLQWPVKIVGVCWTENIQFYFSSIFSSRSPVDCVTCPHGPGLVTRGMTGWQWCLGPRSPACMLYVHNVNLSQSPAQCQCHTNCPALLTDRNRSVGCHDLGCPDWDVRPEWA